jgi:hypothetical protein
VHSETRWEEGAGKLKRVEWEGQLSTHTQKARMRIASLTGSLYIDGIVDKRSRQLLLDTGATMTILNEKTSGKMKERYDIKADQGGYQAGDLVWLYNPKRIQGYSPKLYNQWEGPYEVVTRINDVVYKIKNFPRGKPRIVHFNRFASFQGRNGVEKGQAAQMQCTLAYEGFRDAMILSPPRSIMCIMIHFATRMNFSMMERLNWIMTARKQRKKRVKRRMWARRAAGRKHRPILPPMSQRLMLLW